MGSLDVAKSLTTDIHKKVFKLKSPNEIGLLINILQSSTLKSRRFSHSDFQINGNVLALVDNEGHIYIIDFLIGKYWRLKELESCTVLKLSECNESQLFVGKINGALEIMNIDNGDVIAKLLGHQHPVIAISFSQSNVCISSSRFEAIIWDLSNYNKLQMLDLEQECALKFVVFVPISHHILVCYKDDIIQIWQNGSFEILKQFHPSNWRNYSVKSISFSRNGKVMVVSGYLPLLAIFQLDIWRLLKVINLPEYINTVKKVQFIPQNFDGGCNKLLAVLSGSGNVYFYNVENNIVISELKSKCEISNFSIPCANAQYISCLLCSGNVEVYDVNFYTMKNLETVIVKAQDLKSRHKSKPKLKNFCRKFDIETKQQIEKVLEIDKLKAIIEEYQQFPEAFRETIWEKILKLPNNLQQYNSIVNHVGIVAFDNLQVQFPLEDKVTIRCLRHLLNNIVSWCPFFAQVDFLPCFLFPFVKVFHKKPISCFELCCTIIVNWCQHWFEYHPLPPLNILAIIDNMLIEHDSSILHHFSICGVKPILYSWSLLETAFSEVLTTPEWLMFWDHVFINEPSFLLCAVVGYILLHKKHLLLLSKEEEFVQFFQTQRPLDIGKLLSKSYYALRSTSDRNHPRQYLNMFSCLTCGHYPTFEEYPKEVVEFQADHVNHLEHQLKETKIITENVLKAQQMQRWYDDVDIKNEETKRMLEVEKACIQKIKMYQQNVLKQQDELRILRQELLDQENEIIRNTQVKMTTRKNDEKSRKMEILANGLDISNKNNEIDVNNLEGAYKLESLNLARKGDALEKYRNGDREPNLPFSDQLSLAHEETVRLKNEMKKAKIDLKSPRKADIVLKISTVNSLIDRIRSELENDSFLTTHYSTKENLKVHELEKETQHLQKEISQLTLLLNHKRRIEERLPEPSSSQPTALYTSQPDCNHTCSNKTVRFGASE